MSKISVIVPVYNTDTEYLQKCIDSILEQKGADTELILINDGSVGDAPGVCERAAKEDSRVIYISQENSGVSVARNKGLDAATGDYIMFVDSDDFISPGLFERLLPSMGKGLDILFFGYCTSYVGREMNRVISSPDLSLFTPDTLQLAILNANPRLGPLEVGAPWGKLIRRSVIEDNGLRYTPGLKKGQDTVFTLNLLEHCSLVSYESVAGYHYRVSKQSISHRFSADMVAIMEKTLGAYSSFIERYAKGPVYRRALLNKFYRVLTGEYMDLYFTHPDNPAPSSDMQREFLALCEAEPYRSAIAGVEISTLTGLDRLEHHLVLCKKTKALWAMHKMLRAAKSLIVKDYK